MQQVMGGAKQETMQLPDIEWSSWQGQREVKVYGQCADNSYKTGIPSKTSQIYNSPIESINIPQYITYTTVYILSKLGQNCNSMGCPVLLGTIRLCQSSCPTPWLHLRGQGKGRRARSLPLPLDFWKVNREC